MEHVSRNRGKHHNAVLYLQLVRQFHQCLFFQESKLQSTYQDGPPGCIGLAHCSGCITTDDILCSMEHFLKEHALLPSLSIQSLPFKLSKKDPVLLLFDNQESHISVEVLSLGKDNSIHLLTFPPVPWCSSVCTIEACNQEVDWQLDAVNPLSENFNTQNSKAVHVSLSRKAESSKHHSWF